MEINFDRLRLLKHFVLFLFTLLQSAGFFFISFLPPGGPQLNSVRGFLRTKDFTTSPHRPRPSQPVGSDMDESAVRFVLERRVCLSLRKVLQLKLQQRRSREAVESGGAMPPLKSSAAFHQQRRASDQAQAEEGHKQKVRTESGSPEAIRMRILDGKLQSKHVQHRNVRLADDSNNKVAHRAGPVELVHRNVLPVDACFRQAVTQRRFPKPSGGNSSCDEDSNDSLSPRQSESRERPLGIQPSAEKPTGSNLASPAEVPPLRLPFHLSSTRPNSCVRKTYRVPEIKSHHPSTQKLKKPKASAPKASAPKVKKLKYHQYVPPDKKGDAGPLPDLDSSHAKILQQQQLFLQLQILSQQHHCHAPPPADQDPPPSSSLSDLTSTSSSPRIHIGPSSGTKVPSLHLNLDEMKVAELKCELKLRRLPVSGTRKDLIERLRTHQELGRGGTATPTAGGAREPELARARPCSKAGGGFNASEPSPLRLLMRDGPLLPNGANPVSFNSDPLEELMSSPASDPLPAPLSAAVKPEHRRSGPAPCRFSLKSTSLPERGSVSSTAPAIAAATPPATVDKDRMLQEKDQQIAELTRMLLLNHRLVEELRMQLGNGDRDAPEAHILKRVKEEPPDRSTSPPLVVLRGKEVTTIKEETMEEEIASKMSPQSSGPAPQPHSQTHPQLQQEQVCLQDSARQLAQQQAISRLRLMQRNTDKPQHAAQSVSREAHQKPRLQKQRRSQKRQLETQSEQRRPQPEKTRPKRQVLLREQESVAKKHQQQNNKLQPVQMQSRMHPQQQDLLNNGARPAVVGDSKRTPILISLTNHITGKASNHDASQFFNDVTSLKNKNEERQKCVELQEAAAPRLQSPQTWKNSPSPFCQTEMFPGLDVLLSPLSSDSVETAASPSHDKLRDEDFIDLILQAGETPEALKDGRGFSFSSPCPSPLHLLLSPPNSPCSAALRHDSPLQPGPWTPAKSSDYKQHSDLCGGGRLEDFLEGFPGKPLHGAEPGGLPTLLDDQMMCTTCILDPAPRDSSDSKAWLGFPAGGEREWETSTLLPQTPPSVFSADFLDASDLHMDWDS
ncbi:myocardin-related transcription factor A-like [Poeciliopsis prolifica]|uniref:myocardin-related transcription factor A-like n=1 Tax=Poeciliopsis prolifica TaxID=188132 RepID=UPI0024135DCA|nr:myocardin-related transcription factor A-like [Poeciliopsis prolifica]